MKKHIIIVLSLFVFLFPVTSSHSSVGRNSVSHGSGEEQMASLKAYVACSDTPDYIKKWTTTPTSLGLGIRTVTSFVSGETAYTSVIVRGYAIGEKGNISLEAGFEIIKPDGKILFAEKKYAKYNATGQEEIAFVMLNPSMNINFDNTDQEGVYVLRFHVTDNLARKETVASAKITLRGKNPGVEAKTTLAGKKIAAVEETAPAVIVTKAAEQSVVAGKKVAAVKETAPVVIVTKAAEQPVVAEKKMAAVEKDTPAATAIETSEKITPLKENPGQNILQTEITSAEVLDDLWDYYNTSKDKEAVHRIISILHWIEDGKGLEIAFGGAARLSLTRNALKNETVYLICKKYLQNDDQKNQKYLEKILAKVDAGK